MTDKKPTKTRRPVALPRLYRTVADFCDTEGISVEEPIAVLLDKIQDAWFADARK